MALFGYIFGICMTLGIGYGCFRLHGIWAKSRRDEAETARRAQERFAAELAASYRLKRGLPLVGPAKEVGAAPTSSATSPTPSPRR